MNGEGGGKDPEATPTVDRRVLEALVCPCTQGTLSYDSERQELVSRGAGLAFPIRNGIPIMLIDEARILE
ncbi:Trm112 family protein [Mangrovicoccus sp. HB161399]|uniref:Trm112 family protein n=1 Tax=Mangrovicoccus sp. HB161399 TaxID=2720392 RepID=UPI001557D4AE